MSGSLQPTYFGHVASTKDALILFEACLTGTLSHVPRRPHDRERNALIKSGCVFIYEENASGIKRWTDGVPWSPSRILGNFLVYRELLKPFPPGEKKRATKRNKRPSKPGEPYPRANGDTSSNEGSTMISPSSPVTPSAKSDNGFDKETERALIGSLVDSYGFKEGGLVKKTMSVNVHGVHHHLVSYYKVEDVLAGTLSSPQKDGRLQNVDPRPELTQRQHFRAPLDEIDDGMHDMNGIPAPYGYDHNGYPIRPPGMVMSHASHGHQPPGMMPSYGYSPYASAAPGHQGLPSYTHTAGGSGYMPHNLPAPHGDYRGGQYHEQFQPTNSATGPPPDRSHSQPQPAPASYGYSRQPPGPGLVPRQPYVESPHSMSDGKPSEVSGWRSAGPYAPTSSTPVPLSDGASNYQGHHHWPAPPGQHNVPRQEPVPYGHDTQGWQMQNLGMVNGGRQSYSGGAAHH